MKTSWLSFAAACMVFVAFTPRAATLFVDLNSANPTPPYTNWVTAATNIQDAIDVTTNGDTVLVTNGMYAAGGRVYWDLDVITNRIVVTNNIIVRSVNGPLVTFIQGFGFFGVQYANAIRCVLVTTKALLAGFTITNGWSPGGLGFGGGVYASSSTVISNCVLSGNHALLGGGGVRDGILLNCILNENSAQSGGGAYYSALTNCVVFKNSAGVGGGIYGDTAGGTYSGAANNCLIISNSAGSYGGGALGVSMNNCTVIGNSAGSSGGGIDQPMGPSAVYSNCIIYYNYAPSGPNFLSGTYLINCCTTPLPSGGACNITNAPVFVNLTTGDFHLQSNSPCINAGENPCATNSTDFDGNPRIVGGTVDIGAYEYQTPSSILSYAWPQQYGLPTDGSADYADTDNDGMKNWQEWMAGTNPTSALSLLEMLSLASTNSPSGIVVTWESVSETDLIFCNAATICPRSRLSRPFKTTSPAKPAQRVTTIRPPRTVARISIVSVCSKRRKHLSSVRFLLRCAQCVNCFLASRSHWFCPPWARKLKLISAISQRMKRRPVFTARWPAAVNRAIGKSSWTRRLRPLRR